MTTLFGEASNRWQYFWLEGSYLDPANSWNKNMGVLGVTAPKETTGASLKAGAKVCLIMLEKGWAGCPKITPLTSAPWSK